MAAARQRVRAVPLERLLSLVQKLTRPACRYSATVKLRAARMADRSLMSSHTRLGYHAHALEALVELASFLSLRFPKLFTVERTPYIAVDSSTHGDSAAGLQAGAVKVIHNLVTGDVWDLEAIEREEGPDWNPMRVAGRESPAEYTVRQGAVADPLPAALADLLQDDLAVMVEDENGEYRFQAGSICTAGASSPPRLSLRRSRWLGGAR